MQAQGCFLQSRYVCEAPLEQEWGRTVLKVRSLQFYILNDLKLANQLTN
jgi:hypothetical protein